eukprot:COSAG02_NODE_49_length_45106_cov_298.436177_19_plen_76_part_00
MMGETIKLFLPILPVVVANAYRPRFRCPNLNYAMTGTAFCQMVVFQTLALYFKSPYALPLPIGHDVGGIHSDGSA